jgi:acetoacetyl-CoA synthetase
MSHDDLLWKPTREQMESTILWSFMRYVSELAGETIAGYESLYLWSLEEKAAFWSALWDFCGVVGHKGERILVDENDMEITRWFPEATLNFAENLLRRRGDQTAIFWKIEDGPAGQLTFDQLYERVAGVAAWLRTVGVVRGDRVAGYLPNIPEAVVAMLAAASIGAVWTSTSPDFGLDSVLERFGQTGPKVLFAANGYYYGGKTVDIRPKVEALSQTLESLEHTVVVDVTGRSTGLSGVPWPEVQASDSGGIIQFELCNFSDPLYILYTSGTTDKPKCITHRTGGALLQHLKEHRLHCDVKPGDRVFYYTTCGWMMWNWLASALASEAAVVLYDGSPFHPDNGVLWRYAADVRMTLFGTSAKYLDALKKQGATPGRVFDLGRLRTVCSTGSVLAPENFDYVYESIKRDICLASISGGTDIVSCFVLGCPMLPVYRGECQCRGLGMAVEVYDPSGAPVVEEKGELVCTAPFPSQPAFFWGDESGRKYHNAYFSVYENVWHHGDYAMLTDRGGVVMYGRSDSILNPGGVRIGSAEIYRHVDQLDEVMDSIVIGQEWEGDTRIVLFVVLRPSLTLSEELTQEIRRILRENCSPRHVPSKIIQVSDVPRTKSGKLVESAVREVVHNRPVKNAGALANPEVLALFKDLPELKV